MSILDATIKELKSSEELDKVRELCDKIAEEEHPKMNMKFSPRGPNVILSLQVPSKYSMTATICYLTLERENTGEYVTRYWSVNLLASTKEKPHSRVLKNHDIKEIEAKKVLTEYAKLVKFYRGE